VEKDFQGRGGGSGQGGFFYEAFPAREKAFMQKKPEMVKKVE